MARTSRNVVTVLVLTSALAVTGCSTISDVLGDDGEEPKRDPSGTITETSDSADVFTLKVGDCVGAFGDGDAVEELPVMPCQEPHEMEVFANSEAPDGEYPGKDALMDRANKDCTEEFETFTGAEYSVSDLLVSYLYPTSDTWEQGDREILCVIYQGDENGKPVEVTGSLKNAHNSPDETSSPDQS